MKSLKYLPKKLTLKFAKVAVLIYHGMFPSPARTCRFEPTCSKYLVMAIERHGAVKGLYLFFKRLGSCHPFSTRPIVDPIPQ